MIRRSIGAKSWPGKTKTVRLALLGLVVVVPCGMMVVLGSFDGLYGQDAFAYYDYATGPLRQSLLQLTPPPPFFWPPGYPLLVGLVSLFVGPVPLAGQVVSLIAGGLVPVFTALLAREVWPPSPEGSGPAGGSALTSGAGLATSSLFVPGMAGLVTALNGQLWQSSVVVMADTTGLALAVGGAWALARYGRRSNPGWLILAGAALAGAILTRWAYALVALPCALYGLLLLGQRGSRSALVHGAATALAASVILGPVLIPALAALWAPAGDTAPFAGNLQIYSWHPLNAARREFLTADGYLHYRLPNGLYYALTPSSRFFFTPLLALLILPGLWVVLRRRAGAPLFLLVGWVTVVYSFHAGAPWQNFRFALAFLPPLAVLVAIGMAEMRRVVGKRFQRLVIFSFVAGCVWMVISGVTLTQSFIERKQADLTTVSWVEAQAPPDGRLLTFGLTHTFRHYSSLETLEIFELTPAELAGLLADGRPTWLLLDVVSVEEQWRGRSPWENYHWLRNEPGLVALGRRGPYTLFRVEAGQS